MYEIIVKQKIKYTATYKVTAYSAPRDFDTGIRTKDFANLLDFEKWYNDQNKSQINDLVLEKRDH